MLNHLSKEQAGDLAPTHPCWLWGLTASTNDLSGLSLLIQRRRFIVYPAPFLEQNHFPNLLQWQTHGREERRMDVNCLLGWRETLAVGNKQCASVEEVCGEKAGMWTPTPRTGRDWCSGHRSHNKYQSNQAWQSTRHSPPSLRLFWCSSQEKKKKKKTCMFFSFSRGV